MISLDASVRVRPILLWPPKTCLDLAFVVVVMHPKDRGFGGREH